MKNTLKRNLNICEKVTNPKNVHNLENMFTFLVNVIKSKFY